MTNKYILVNKFFQPACTSNTLIQPHRPEHGQAPCVCVAIASQKTPLRHIVKNHFEIMSNIHQNTLNNTKMRLEISVSHFYVSNLRLFHYYT